MPRTDFCRIVSRADYAFSCISDMAIFLNWLKLLLTTVVRPYFDLV